MKVLDLFSGIGGFSLGLERAGFETVQFVEIDPRCQSVLRRHWPDVPIHGDVRTFAPTSAYDVVCGGFPCQDISVAGLGAGLSGARSGLWTEFARIIEAARPRYAIIENVSALRHRGLDKILLRLSALGYDAEWHCIPASAVGAPHRRDRVWIIAYANSDHVRHESRGRSGQSGRAAAVASDHGARGPLADSGRELSWRDASARPTPERREALHFASGHGENVADADSHARIERRFSDPRKSKGGGYVDRGGIGANNVADADSRRQQGERLAQHSAEQSASGHQPNGRGSPGWRHGSMPDTIGERLQRLLARGSASAAAHGTGYGHYSEWWAVEPDVGRVANGIPQRVDRLRELGNAVVPQIPELIGRAIMMREAGA